MGSQGGSSVSVSRVVIGSEVQGHRAPEAWGPVCLCQGWSKTGMIIAGSLGQGHKVTRGPRVIVSRGGGVGLGLGLGLALGLGSGFSFWFTNILLYPNPRSAVVHGRSTVYVDLYRRRPPQIYRLRRPNVYRRSFFSMTDLCDIDLW